jgi:hypothetical protein
MNTNPIPITSLQVGDIEKDAVWQYSESEQGDDTVVRPVKRLPVKNLTGKVVATKVRLANGSLVWALVGNVDIGNPRLTEHFLTLSIEKDGRWFALSRYHDFDYSERGPEALAKFLDLPVNEVFPISYDIAQYVKGVSAALSGAILKEPHEKLTRAEIIALAVP